MKTIYKYPIRFGGATKLELPKGAILLRAALQAGNPCLWFELEPETEFPMEERLFTIVGTGHVVPDPGIHIDTELDGDFVWHFYEIL